MATIVGLSLLASLAMPFAAAHWAAGSTHDHPVLSGSSVTAGWYFGQRVCVDPSVVGTTLSNQYGECPSTTLIPVPPFRGLTTGLGDCEDQNGATPANIVTNLKTTTAESVVLDYAGDAANFAHIGTAANPTGGYTSTPAVTPNPVANVAQVQRTKIGLGPVGADTSTQLFPGIDVGDNDFEVGYGIACHTYEIDSSSTVEGAWLNNPLGITGLVGTGTGMSSSDLTKGFRINPTVTAVDITYSLCNNVAGHGCTNIPHGVTGAVYSSLQDCVWLAAGGPGYGGEQAEWGTSTPTGRTCWPERLVLDTGINVYVPQSLTGLAWNPDHLPDTARDVESITVFFDVGGTRLGYGAAACDPGSSVTAPTNCGSQPNPIATDQASAGNVVATSAVFQ